MNSFSTPALSAGAAAAVRILTLVLGPYAIGAGWVDADQVDGIATSVVTIGVAGWALFQTIKRQKTMNKTEERLGTPLKSLIAD